MKDFFKDEAMIYANYTGTENYPEGSIDCLKESFEFGAQGVSINVQFSSDGVPMAISRDEISQLCDKSGEVSHYTAEALKSFDAGYTFANSEGDYIFRGKGYTFPTLLEVLQAFPDKKFHVNILGKDVKNMTKYIDLLKTGDFCSRIFTSSMYTSVIKIVRREVVDAATSMSFWEFIRTYALFRTGLLRLKSNFPGDIYQVPENIGVSNLSDSSIINLLHSAGLKVYLWNINTEADIERLRNAGVDAFMTGDIEMAARVLN